MKVMVGHLWVVVDTFFPKGLFHVFSLRSTTWHSWDGMMGPSRHKDACHGQSKHHL